MNIEITRYGTLIIERPKNRRIEQRCIRDYDVCCGDHCPLFGTPSYGVDFNRKEDALQLCEVKLYGDITDLRGKPLEEGEK